MTEHPPAPDRLIAASTTSGHTLALARIEHATPTPQAGDLWRARWNDRAGVVLVLDPGTTRVRVAPVSLDAEPDETAVHSSAATNTLDLDAAIWTSDEADIPVRVLDYKLGQLTAAPATLPHGSTNWGPTDPRSLVRAQLQDLVEHLEAAHWAPASSTDLDLAAVLTGADVRAIAQVLGSPARAAALRRGQVDLTTEEAARLSDVLGVPADDLIAATRPPLPPDLVAAMDLPNVRSLVDQLAARHDAEEVETWSAAAYGVLALAARDHDRRDVRWAGRIRAYFEAHLREDPAGPAR